MNRPTDEDITRELSQNKVLSFAHEKSKLIWCDREMRRLHEIECWIDQMAESDEQG